jgi:predicted ATP-dependent Lon-type protease
VIKKVGVSLIGNYKKVVMNISRFEFIQTDAVSKRYKPRSLKISIRDGNERISDEKMLTFGANNKSKEAIKIAFDYFKANISRVSSLALELPF